MRRIGYALLMYSVMILMTLPLVGCDDYDEGDTVAQQRFEKFTSQEKTLYKAVQDVWGQQRLMFVREAVGKREARPAENMIPFSDISNVIKSNNSAALTLRNDWTTSTKNKYIKARWDRVDEKWYRELMLSMGETEVIKQDFIPEPVEKVIEDKPEIEPDHYGDRPWVAPQEETVKIDLNDIISESKYDDLYYEIRKCDEAVQTYKQIIDNRILTQDDYNLLMRISIKCKAIQIGDKLTEWKK
jgi:hypothetical protein